MFKSLYDSPLIATLLPCIASLVVVLWAQTKQRRARMFGSIFGVAIAADAFLNGPWTPVKNGTWALLIGLIFVIIGDLRYFVLIEESLHSTHKVLRATLWAIIVPAIVLVARMSTKKIADDERSMFLLYELLFFVLAIAIRTFRVNKMKLASRATTFELVQYGTWIVADVGLTFTRGDAFYAPRLAANLMYYVAFVPVMTRLLC